MGEAGSLFLFGVYGRKPTRETAALLKRTGAGGVLLLARNIETPAQTRALTEELVQRVGRPLLFAVDHEGGWVLRFKSGVTAFPGNAALGRARDPKLAYAVGRRMALELGPLGINLNLAPVVDVLGDAYNPGIGIRSFGKDPALVSRLGAAFIRGLQDHGVGACAKHFPGKGAATQDAHVTLPTIRIPRARFERVHLAPFAAAVRAGVDCVMTSHVRFPALDSAPATFSARITRGLLRERLGFRGVVISDDLCMGAVTGRLPIQLAAVRAIEAGHDLLIIAHDVGAQEEAAEQLEAAAADGAVAASAVRDSAARIRRLLLHRSKAPRPAAGEGGERLSRLVSEKAVEVVRRGAARLPFRSNGKKPLVLIPDFREVADRFTFEGGPEGPERRLRAALERWGPARVRRVPVESSDLKALLPEIRREGKILFFCFEAMRFPGQKAALEAINREAPERTAVCLIRNPEDRKLLGPRVTAVDAYGYRSCQLDAALKVLLEAKR